MSLRTRRLAAIRRRIEYLSGRIAERTDGDAIDSYYRCERDALTWAYNICLRVQEQREHEENAYKTEAESCKIVGTAHRANGAPSLTTDPTLSGGPADG